MVLRREGLRARSIAFMAVPLSLVVSAVSAQEPPSPVTKPPLVQTPPAVRQKPVVQPPAADPAANPPPAKPLSASALLTARLGQPLSRPRTIQIDSVRWSCRNDTCTTTDLAGSAPEIGACQTLRRQAGKIRSFGTEGHQLSSSDIQQCNRPSLDRPPGPVVFGDGRTGARLPNAPAPRPGAIEPSEDDGAPEDDVPSGGMIAGVNPPEMPRTASPARRDFVAFQRKPSLPPASGRVATGPPVRRDFIGHDERPPRPEFIRRPPSRPPMRIDFEGPAAQPEAPVTPESE